MDKVTLSKPISANGTEINVLQLNFDVLSVADLRQVKKLEAQISDKQTVDAKDMAMPKNLSFEFQLASGFLAAVKGTDGLQIDDFTMLSMSDALAIAQAANFFGWVWTENTGGHTPLHGTVLLTGICLA